MGNIYNKIRHFEKNGDTFYLGHCFNNDYVFKFEMIDGEYHVWAKSDSGREFEISMDDADVLDVRYDSAVITKEEYDSYGVAEFVEVNLTYHPCVLQIGNPVIHIKITKNLTEDMVSSCKVFANNKLLKGVPMPDIISDVINKHNAKILQSVRPNDGSCQLDGGYIDYNIRVSCRDLDMTVAEHSVGESNLPDNRMLKLLCRWCEILSANNNILTLEHTKSVKEQQTELFSALVRLDVAGVKEGLEKCDIEADFIDDDEEDLTLYDEDDAEDRKYLAEILKHRRCFMPLISIPIAWDWMIHDPAGWSDNVGYDYQKRNDEIKCLLAERLNIDWDNVPEDALPDALARCSMDDDDDDPTYGLFDYDWETMISKYRQKDVELYIAGNRLVTEEAKRLIAEGADPEAKLFQGEDILDLLSARTALSEIVIRDYMSGEETYCDTSLDAYKYACGNLIHAAAYERMYRILTKEIIIK